MSTQVFYKDVSGLTLYALIFNPANAGQVYEGTAAVALDGTSWPLAAIALTDASGYGVYAFTFPALPAGRYPYVIYQQGGGSPDPTDTQQSGLDYIEWDGAALVPLSTVSTSVTAVSTSVAALPTANQNADALLDRANGVETGLTLRQALRLVTAFLFGKVSGASSGPLVFRDYGDTKNRITMTTDSSGNRSAVTRDVS